MAMFKRLGESELAGLDDDLLIAYAIEARSAGETETAKLALQIFAFGMEDALRAYVRNRMDSHGDAVIEEVAERALEDTIRSILNLRGETAPEARAFVFKVARFRIADYLRSGRVDETPIEVAQEGQLGRTPGTSRHEESLQDSGDIDRADVSLVLREVLVELRPDHRAAVELYVLDGYSAREAAELANRRLGGESDDSTTEQNVHQIGSRFRRDLRARLEEAGRG